MYKIGEKVYCKSMNKNLVVACNEGNHAYTCVDIFYDIPDSKRFGTYVLSSHDLESGWMLKIKNPDMRGKVKEYIVELDEEIDRCENWIEENTSVEACAVTAIETRLQTLNEVKNDLQGKLEELI